MLIYSQCLEYSVVRCRAMYMSDHLYTNFQERKHIVSLTEKDTNVCIRALLYFHANYSVDLLNNFPITGGENV